MMKGGQELPNGEQWVPGAKAVDEGGNQWAGTCGTCVCSVTIVTCQAANSGTSSFSKFMFDQASTGNCVAS